MKKLFSMMLIAASLFAVSCDKDDNDVNDDNGTYVGAMAIDMTFHNQTLSTTQDDVTYLFEDGDDSATVTLSGVSFTGGLADAINALGIPNFSMDEDPYMPALTIVLPNIPETSDNIYEAATITPTTTDGEPFSADTLKSVSNVKVTEVAGALTVSFDCVMSLYMGSDTASEVTATITYAGRIK